MNNNNNNLDPMESESMIAKVKKLTAEFETRLLLLFKEEQDKLKQAKRDFIFARIVTYNTQEVADILKISAKTVSEMCARGEIKAIRSKKWIVRHEDLEDYLRKNEHQTE